jgi:hypothetical protein
MTQEAPASPHTRDFNSMRVSVWGRRNGNEALNESAVCPEDLVARPLFEVHHREFYVRVTKKLE